MTAIPQHMLFFLYWSVSLFCILNLRPHQTQLASSIVALRAARWRACVCVVGRVVGYKDEVLRHKLDHISFNRPLLFFISKESFNYDLFIHPVFVFCLLHRHRDTDVRVCIHTHTHFQSRSIDCQVECKKALCVALLWTTAKTTARIFKWASNYASKESLLCGAHGCQIALFWS